MGPRKTWHLYDVAAYNSVVFWSIWWGLSKKSLADIYGWWLTLIPKVCCWLKMFVVPWWLCELHDSVWVGCRRRPEHWVGTQLNIGSVSLSNTKRLLTGCLHSFMRGVGFTNVFIFCMCSFACSGFGVSYPPILVGYGHLSVDCKLKHRCAVSCGHVQQ